MLEHYPDKKEVAMTIIYIAITLPLLGFAIGLMIAKILEKINI
jgi:hypothetical protein